MSSKQAILVTDGLPFGGTVLGEDGEQVLLPIIAEVEWAAAPRKGKNRYPAIKLTAALPPDACPAIDDVSWMQFFRPDGKGGKLLDAKVVLVFEKGTLKVPVKA
ncbi:hypothetical protein LCGC14_1240360 [marine sediment metagenome]|uniref:Uncharacterized protein n=1 Tax=marine sediment metagenome TaxID=412755 RepID=A0A0F9LTA1_9ZZZZ